MQGQVNEVKVILTDNINKVLERGDRLDDLIGKTDDLQASVSIRSWAFFGRSLNPFYLLSYMKILCLAVLQSIFMLFVHKVKLSDTLSDFMISGDSMVCL